MSSPAREVVVTGVGACCHMGDDLDAMLRSLKSGTTEARFTRWSPAVEYAARCQLLGEYPGTLDADSLGVGAPAARFMGRASLLALHATRLALAQAQTDPHLLAVAVGSGTGDVAAHREVAARLERTGDAKRCPPSIIPRLMGSTVSANLATELGCTGPSFSVTAACSGGAYNILLAAELVANGHVDGAIAGGVEVADLHFFVGFDAMRAFNSVDNDAPERASRPYASDRAGFIFSEGAGVVVLEAREVAERRGATILGRICGYGLSSDGDSSMVVPSADGAELALRNALRHAGIGPDDVDYVNTHGTSTQRGDVSEVEALRRVFGDRHIAYSSTKGYTGHTISAAGALEAIFCLAMLRDGWIAPCLNAEPLDPQFEDYPPVLKPTTCSLRYVMSSSLGFGGTNATLVLAAS